MKRRRARAKAQTRSRKRPKKTLSPPPQQLPYEVWLHIAGEIGMGVLRAFLKQGWVWTMNHPLLTALRETMRDRLKAVAEVVNPQRNGLCPTAAKARPPGFCNLRRPGWADRMRILEEREDAHTFAALCSPSVVGASGLPWLWLSLSGFFRAWISLLVLDHPFFVGELTEERSDAALPHEYKTFWRNTRVCSVRIHGVFLTYHYDIHLKVGKNQPDDFEVTCCAPCRWECKPECVHRDWATWSTMELRERLLKFLMEGLDWLMGDVFTRLRLAERYCNLKGEDVEPEPKTHSKVCIAGDIMPPRPRAN